MKKGIWCLGYGFRKLEFLREARTKYLCVSGQIPASSPNSGPLFSGKVHCKSPFREAFPRFAGEARRADSRGNARNCLAPELLSIMNVEGELAEVRAKLNLIIGFIVVNFFYARSGLEGLGKTQVSLG